MSTASRVDSIIDGNPCRIVILPHTSPDADALGSSLALGRYLQRKKHHVKIISPTEYPEFLAWMPDVARVMIYGKEKEAVEKHLREAQLIVIVDLSSPSRLGGLENMVTESSTPKVLFDHHPEKAPHLADYTFRVEDCAATAEIIYNFIARRKETALIDRDIALCLYAGILTDTQSFHYSNNLARTHHISQQLILKGNIQTRDILYLHEHLWGNYSEGRIRMLGHALSHCLHVLSEYNTAFFVLNEEDLSRFGIQEGDTEGLVNYTLLLRNIRLGALIKQQGKSVRLSFRSKGHFDVNQWAFQHFNGGGHTNAAGGSSQAPIESVVKRFTTLLKDYKSALA